MYRIRVHVDSHDQLWWAIERADTGEVLILCASYRSAVSLL